MIEMDIFYLRNISLSLDLKIILRTLPAIVGQFSTLCNRCHVLVLNPPTGKNLSGAKIYSSPLANDSYARNRRGQPRPANTRKDSHNVNMESTGRGRVTEKARSPGDQVCHPRNFREEGLSPPRCSGYSTGGLFGRVFTPLSEVLTQNAISRYVDSGL